MGRIIGVCTIFPTCRACADLSRTAAYTLLLRAKRSRQVVVDPTIAIVVFAVALGFCGFIIRRVRRIIGTCTSPPTTRAPASLFRPAACALLIRAVGRNKVVVDLAVAIVVFAIAYFGLFDGIARTGPPLAVGANLCARLALTFASVGVGAFDAARTTRITRLVLSVLTLTTRVDLAVAIVVFAVALGFRRLIIRIVCGVRGIIAIFPTSCSCTGLSCAIANP